MKGLWIKDLRLLRQQKHFILLMAAMMMILIASGESSDFMLAYFVFMAALLPVTTLSWDEAKDGYTFLFTMPCTKKDYIFEKYLLCAACCLAACLIGGMVYIVSLKGTISQMTGLTGFLFPLVLLYLALMLPLQIRFGSSKSRIVLFAVAALAGFLLSMGGMAAESFLGVFMSLNWSLTAWMFVLWMAALGLYGLSCWISLQILRKKEF